MVPISSKWARYRFATDVPTTEIRQNFSGNAEFVAYGKDENIHVGKRYHAASRRQVCAHLAIPTVDCKLICQAAYSSGVFNWHLWDDNAE